MTPPSKALRIVWAGVGCLAFAAWVGSTAPADEGTPESSHDTSFHASGSLQPASSVDLVNETGDAAVLLWVAPEGKKVKKGGLLAELDATDLVKNLDDVRLRLDVARANLAAAEASLEAEKKESEAAIRIAEMAVDMAAAAREVFEKGELKLQTKSLEVELKLAEKQHEVAARRMERLEALRRVRPEADTEDHLAQAELQALEAQARIEIASARLEHLTGFLRPLKVKELEAAVAQRELELLRARSELACGAQKGEAELIAVRAQLRKESEELASIERRIAACKIHAPFDGLVLYAQPFSEAERPATRRAATARRGPHVPLQRGTVIRDSRPVLQLIDVSRCRLEVEIPLEIAQKMSTGQEVAIRVDAFPEERLGGKIASMGVSRRTRPAGEPPQATITILIENPTGNLRPGMTATALREAAPQE